MKNNINIAALKKALKKDDYIHYYEKDNNIMFWNSRGYFAIKISKNEFELVKEKLYSKLKKVNSMPAAVENALENIIDNEIINTNFIFNYKDDYLHIFKNSKNEFIPVNRKYIDILENVIVIKQRGKYAPVQFLCNNNTIVIIMPIKLDILQKEIDNIFKSEV